MKSIFVTGTGTGVGKTRLCGLLLGFLRQRGIDAVYQKWVATGPEGPGDDAGECLRLAGIARGTQGIVEVLYHLPLPVSPHLAAEQAGAKLDPAVIRQKYAERVAGHAFTIVEGAGGVLVPLARNLLLADLVAELKIPTLVVAKSGLGSINHGLLTLEALRTRDIPVLGLVFSDSDDEEDELVAGDNLRTIAELGQARVFGRLRRCLTREEAMAGFAPVGEKINEVLERF